MGDDEARAEPLRLAAVALDVRRRPFVGLDRAGEFVFDPRAEHLDGDVAAVGGDGAVDLRDRGRTDRLLPELGEQPLERHSERGFDRLLDGGERRGRKVVLQLRQILRRALADQVGPGRQRLPELDRGGTDFLQRLRVIGGGRNVRSDTRNAREPPNLRRSHRVFLDALQRAVPGERPAPFE